MPSPGVTRDLLAKLYRYTASLRCKDTEFKFTKLLIYSTGRLVSILLGITEIVHSVPCLPKPDALAMKFPRRGIGVAGS